MASLSSGTVLSSVAEGFVGLGEFVTSIMDGSNEISTEQAVTLFAGVAGVGGFISQVFASKRLEQVQGDTIPVRMMFPAIVLSGAASAVAGAALVPNSRRFFSPPDV